MGVYIISEILGGDMFNIIPDVFGGYEIIYKEEKIMEVKEKVIKVYTLELTEEEALDLRSILNLHIEDYYLMPTQFQALVERLKWKLGKIEQCK